MNKNEKNSWIIVILDAEIVKFFKHHPDLNHSAFIRDAIKYYMNEVEA